MMMPMTNGSPITPQASNFVKVWRATNSISIKRCFTMATDMISG